MRQFQIKNLLIQFRIYCESTNIVNISFIEIFNASKKFNINTVVLTRIVL